MFAATLGRVCVFAACLAARSIAASSEGAAGGVLVVGERSQPKTLNPLLSPDNVSRDILGLVHADLVHINRSTQLTEPALAVSWKISPDGKRYLLKLRRDVKFSDGHPFDADDVLFTWRVALDPKVGSAQRDLLIVAGKPIAARKIDAFTVEFDLPEPYGPAERIFDGIAMLPRHLLERAYLDGRFDVAWSLGTDPSAIAGLGPFRLKQYTPGQRLVLEKNPYYWKQRIAGTRLPYLESVVFDFAASESARVLRLESGDVDVVARMSAADFEALAARNRGRWQLKDSGPSLEYNFLFFNLNDLPAGSAIARHKQAWFNDANFRRAVSAAVDREGLARLVYAGRATPIWTNVTPGNRFWINTALPKPPRSIDEARRLLAASGFRWNRSGALEDRAGNAVEFTIATSSTNVERSQMATILQDDLKKLGMSVRIVTFEQRSLISRITESLDFEAAVMGLGIADTDPVPDMPFLLSTGGTHLWRMKRSTPEPPWQLEIDRLLNAQMASRSRAERKRDYDKVQQILFEYVPFIPLVSPNVLSVAKSGLANFAPTILPPYTLGNADELHWAAQGQGR